MKKNLAITFPGGEYKDNYILVGAAETIETITVPAGKRWLLFYVFAKPDVSATVNAVLYDDDDKAHGYLGAATAGTTIVMFPDDGSAGELNGGSYPFIIPAGYYIKFTFGAGQGAAAYVGVAVLEI